MEHALKLVPPQRVCTCLNTPSTCSSCKSNRAWAIIGVLRAKNADTGFVVPKNPSDQFMKSVQWLADRQNGMID